jgi:hypothetical protein
MEQNRKWNKKFIEIEEQIEKWNIFIKNNFIDDSKILYIPFRPLTSLYGNAPVVSSLYFLFRSLECLQLDCATHCGFYYFLLWNIHAECPSIIVHNFFPKNISLLTL